MQAIACCVFAWSHQGRREGLPGTVAVISYPLCPSHQERQHSLIDGSGRVIRYLGRLVIMVSGPDVSRRMLALSEDDEEWMLL